MQLTIRKCSKEDVDELSAFSERLFYEAYGGTCPEADLLAYMEEAFAVERILSEIEERNSAFYYLFADSILCGYMKLLDEPGNECIELERLYISKDMKRLGLGTYLMEHAEKMAWEKGRRYIWLSVWTENMNAVNFYRKHGFYETETHEFLVGDDIQIDYFMRKDI